MSVPFDIGCVEDKLMDLKYYARDKRHTELDRQSAMELYTVFNSLLEEYNNTNSQLIQLQILLAGIMDNIKNIVEFVNGGIKDEDCH